jgi:hypothetical protein
VLPFIQRKAGGCGCGGTCGACSAEAPLVQRKAGGCACGGTCASCAEEEPVLRKAGGARGRDLAANPLGGLGAGSRLGPSERSFFEPRFGRGLDHVRVHTGPQAALSARRLSSLAYTVGNDIVFGAHQYAPETSEGRRLLAHELTHTVQQSDGRAHAHGAHGVSQPGDPLEREADAAAEAVMSGRGVDPGGLSHGGEGVVHRDITDYLPSLPSLDDVRDAGSRALDTAGEVLEGAGETVEEAVDTVAGIATELWDLANAFATTLSGTVSVSGTTLLVNVPRLKVPYSLEVEFDLPEITLFEAMLPVLRIPILPNVQLYGAVGLKAAIQPSVSGQLGPGSLNGLRIVIDPLGPKFSARGGLTVLLAMGLRAELKVGARGEVGATIIVPVGGIPIPIDIPVVALEAGLAGIARGIVADEITVSGHMSYAGGVFNIGGERKDRIGLALDLGAAGYGSLEALGFNLCTLYWPLWESNHETTISLGGSLDVTIDTSGVTIDAKADKPEVDAFPFSDLPVKIRTNIFSNCPLAETLDLVCKLLYALGLQPSQNGGSWTGHPGAPIGGPIDVYPRTPPGYVSQCRGACGPDCTTCGQAKKFTWCEDNGDGTHTDWAYTDYALCDTHEGCRHHDACYDWCSGGGAGGIWTFCHRRCDLECLCNYGGLQCIGWIFGSPPHDGRMRYAESKDKTDPIPGRCPPPSEEPQPPGGLCLPDDARIQILDLIEFMEGTGWVSDNIPFASIPIEVGPLGIIFVTFYVRAGVSGGIYGALGPVWLDTLCFTVDPLAKRYGGSAKLHLGASLGVGAEIEGTIGGDVNLDCILELLRIEGTLIGSAWAEVDFDLSTNVRVMWDNGRITLDQDLSLDTCLELGAALDAALSVAVLAIPVYNNLWNLAEWKWRDCWPWKIVVGSGGGGSGFSGGGGSSGGGGASGTYAMGGAGAAVSLRPASDPWASFLGSAFAAANLVQQPQPSVPDDVFAAQGKPNPCPVEQPVVVDCNDPRFMTVYAPTGSDRGETVTAIPLTKCGPPGSPPGIRLPGWSCIDAAGENRFWVHAHLLHGRGTSRDLHGPGEAPNLIITDKSLNINMFLRAESRAIGLIHDEGKVLWYEATSVPVAGSGDRRYFGSAITVSFGEYDIDTGLRKNTLFSGSFITRRPIPPGCT